MELDRRKLLIGAGLGLAWPAAIARAAAVDADVRTGTIADVQHVVILMQENRGFDHYFGTMAGVRGFGDPFPIPSAVGPPGSTIWTQHHDAGRPVMPFRLDTTQNFAWMCAQGTPHTWPDAQAAWDEGRMSHWPQAKSVRAMGHYAREDIPFQFALAEAFTLCDAYHCSAQTGTNTNRLFLWTGTNDPAGTHGGPAIGNSHDSLPKDGGAAEGYRCTTYAERLQAAGIDWRIYQDMANNFSDNPLAGFQRFRDAHAAGPAGPDYALVERGFSTHTLDRLRADVLAGALPQISYVIAGASDSEHPVASSPAQGADYTARVLDALTADPKVWSRTVLLVMYDENDGYFDHMPPPAPPSRDPAAPGGFAGASTISTEGEYHLIPSVADAPSERPELIGRPYGLGPRVPLTVISPWSRGGWVNSEIFDHTSVIRFLERRFGVAEPNISPWRRAVCGDLTSAFDFAHPNRAGPVDLPVTAERADRAARLLTRPAAAPDATQSPPAQARGVRRSRALGYALDVRSTVERDHIRLTFANRGQLGVVFQVYDRLHLDRVPRRYTVTSGNAETGDWQLSEAGKYDLWLIGPNGFHRRFTGHCDDQVAVNIQAQADVEAVILTITNSASRSHQIEIGSTIDGGEAKTVTVPGGGFAASHWPLHHGWYDLKFRISGNDTFVRRLAGRIETGRN